MAYNIHTHLSYQIRQQAGAMVAKTFLYSICYTSIYEGEDSWREKQLQYMFERNLHIIHNKCNTCLYYAQQEGGTDIICFFMLVPKRYASTTLFEMIAHGLLYIPFHVGFDKFNRLLATADWFDAQEKEIMNKYDDYLSLQRMVVHPDYQRKGIGSYCLGTVLNDNKDQAIFLSTQFPENVKFYETLRFKLVKTAFFSPQQPKQQHQQQSPPSLPLSESPLAELSPKTNADLVKVSDGTATKAVAAAGDAANGYLSYFMIKEAVKTNME